MLNQGAIEVNDLTGQVRSQGKSLNRVVLGALPRGKHVKPLVSEYGAYINAVSSVQCDADLQSFLKKLPKGSNYPITASFNLGYDAGSDGETGKEIDTGEKTE